MTESTASDELRHLVFEARREQLVMFEPRTIQGGKHALQANVDLVAIVEDSLSKSAQSALDSMSRSNVLLGCQSSSRRSSGVIGALEADMVELSRQMFDLETQIQQADDLISNLLDQLSHTEKAILQHGIYTKDDSGIDTDDMAPEHPSLHSQILQHQREIKQLSLKADEYLNRLANLSHVQPLRVKSDYPTVADIASELESLDRKRKQISQLQDIISSFHGLPPDVHSSRQEVKRALGELDRLQTKRDDLFATLTE